MLANTLNEVHITFANNTINNGGNWRILRVDTLIDLFINELGQYLIDKKKERITLIFEYSIQLFYNNDNGYIDPIKYSQNPFTEGDINSLLEDCNEYFDEFVEKVPKAFEIRLMGEYEYLKQLRLYDYSGVIKETVYSILKNLVDSHYE